MNKLIPVVLGAICTQATFLKVHATSPETVTGYQVLRSVEEVNNAKAAYLAVKLDGEDDFRILYNDDPSYYPEHIFMFRQTPQADDYAVRVSIEEWDENRGIVKGKVNTLKTEANSTCYFWLCVDAADITTCQTPKFSYKVTQSGWQNKNVITFGEDGRVMIQHPSVVSKSENYIQADIKNVTKWELFYPTYSTDQVPMYFVADGATKLKNVPIVTISEENVVTIEVEDGCTAYYQLEAVGARTSRSTEGWTEWSDENWRNSTKELSGDATLRVKSVYNDDPTLESDYVEHAMTFSGQTTSISVIENNHNSPAKYFDIYGREVSSDQLQSGVYIIREGNTTHKIVVK